MPDHFPSDEVFTQYAQQRVTLYPEKFGTMGQYSREMLKASTAEDVLSFTMDTLLMRLTTSVLCGSSITETPQVELNVPASWQQHLKHAFSGWFGKKLALWNGRNLDGTQTTPPPWLILLWPLFVLFPKWLAKHPVKWTTVKADINFSQRIMYPEIDAPAQCGRPVIYETIDVSYPGIQPPFGSRLINDSSRFLNKHEIIYQFRSDPAFAQQFGRPDDPFALLIWLERHGVNTDQLVKRG